MWMSLLMWATGLAKQAFQYMLRSCALSGGIILVTNIVLCMFCFVLSCIFPCLAGVGIIIGAIPWKRYLFVVLSTAIFLLIVLSHTPTYNRHFVTDYRVTKDDIDAVTFSELAYLKTAKSFHVMEDLHTCYQWDHVGTHEDPETTTKAIIYRQRGTSKIFIAFRGSTTNWYSDWWRGNFNFSNAFIDGFQVHGGYKHGLDAIISNIVTDLFAIPGNHSLYITGHSKGGALAQLATLQIAIAYKHMQSIIDKNKLSQPGEPTWEPHKIEQMTLITFGQAPAARLGYNVSSQPYNHYRHFINKVDEDIIFPWDIVPDLLTLLSKLREMFKSSAWYLLLQPLDGLLAMINSIWSPETYYTHVPPIYLEDKDLQLAGNYTASELSFIELHAITYYRVLLLSRLYGIELAMVLVGSSPKSLNKIRFHHTILDKIACAEYDTLSLDLTHAIDFDFVNQEMTWFPNRYD